MIILCFDYVYQESQVVEAVDDVEERAFLSFVQVDTLEERVFRQPVLARCLVKSCYVLKGNECSCDVLRIVFYLRHSSVLPKFVDESVRTEEMRKFFKLLLSCFR